MKRNRRNTSKKRARRRHECWLHTQTGAGCGEGRCLDHATRPHPIKPHRASDKPCNALPVLASGQGEGGSNSPACTTAAFQCSKASNRIFHVLQRPQRKLRAQCEAKLVTLDAFYTTHFRLVTVSASRAPLLVMGAMRCQQRTARRRAALVNIHKKRKQENIWSKKHN